MSTNYVEYLESSSLLASATKTGTVSVAAAGTTLAGSGTLFTTEAPVGSVIRVLDDTGIPRDLVVSAVGSNTSCTIGAAPAAITAKQYRVLDITVGNPSYFIANTAVPVVAAVLGTYNVMNNSGLFKFDWNENVLLESLALKLPYQFTIAGESFNASQSVDSVAVSFLYTDASGVSQSVIPLGGSGAVIRLPFENAEFPINQLIPVPSFATSGSVRWGIAAICTPNISMLNVPSSLNGRYLPIRIGMRIRHQTAIT